MVVRFLVDYIINTHHKYVKNQSHFLLEYTAKVAKVTWQGTFRGSYYL